MIDQVHVGDCLDVLPRFADELAPADRPQVCVTSPPYWGLRDYGNGGGIGLEESLDDHLDAMVRVFREVRRVLRPDGTLWLNYGDAYVGSGMGANGATGQMATRRVAKARETGRRVRVPALKPKDLIGLPWRVAFALQEDGWWLRTDIVWHKPSPMPEAVRDRPTRSHEFIFLLAPSARYFYDADAISEPASTKTNSRGKGLATPKQQVAGEVIAARRTRGGPDQAGGRFLPRPRQNDDFAAHTAGAVARRNKRDVWTIRSEPYSGAHFATFPEEVPRTCIQAGTSREGGCSQCGAPWIRATDVSYEVLRGPNDWVNRVQDPRGQRRSPSATGHGVAIRSSTTTGWNPSCSHDAPPRAPSGLGPLHGQRHHGRRCQTPRPAVPRHRTQPRIRGARRETHRPRHEPPPRRVPSGGRGMSLEVQHG